MQYGKETPRVYTKRQGAGHRGNEFISFCENILQVEVMPWERWLAPRALIVDDAGNYIYRVILVIMARQNGKTSFATKITAWWLYEDIMREQDRLIDASVLGFAQNIETALKPWNIVGSWFSNDDKVVLGKFIGTERANAMLAEQTHRIYTGNGNKTILLKNGVTYRARDAINARGESASRVMLDEVREQTSMDGWASVRKLIRTFRDGQVWAITSGADSKSVLQKDLHERALAQLDSPNATIGLFEWSAEPDCELDDVDQVLQANPSIGYIPALTVERVMAERFEETEAVYRCESLAISSDTIDRDALFTLAGLKDSYVNQPRKDDIERRCMVEYVSNDHSYSGVLGGILLKDGRIVVGMMTDLRAGTLYGKETLDGLDGDFTKVYADSHTGDLSSVYDAIHNKQLMFLDGSDGMVESLALTKGTFQLGTLVLKYDGGYMGALGRVIKTLRHGKTQYSVYNERGLLAV